MKLSTSPICVLILFNLCIVNSLPFSIGSFFRSHSSQKALGEATPPSPDELTAKFRESELTEEENTSSYSSESYSEYRSDSDVLYNSSSDQEFMDSLSWNSSSDSNDTSQSDSVHNSTLKSGTEGPSTPEGPLTPEGSSRFHGSESSSQMHSLSESSDSSEVTWNKVTTPAPPQSTTLGQIAAANFTTEEQEEVVLVTGETTTNFGPKTIFQKSLDWVEDEYTLSILLPISAGIIFAITIICTIAMCRCIRRCCRRRRFRKKCLPDSVRSLSASDRARLLGDTSDEEF